jgi:hypothetical protein
MINQFDRLVGMTLLQFDADNDSLGLVFDDCTLRCFTRWSCSVPIESLLGAVVGAVDFEMGDAVVFEFSSAGRLSLSLNPSHCSGPEALVAQFADGAIVVE